MKQLKQNLEKFEPYTYTALRVVAGLALAIHGYQKLSFVPMFADSVGKLGFPMPEVFAWAAILTELIGGIMLMLGLFTNIVTIPLMFVMLVASFGVHWNAGYADDGSFNLINAFAGPGGFEFPFLYFLVFLNMCTKGSGKYSLDTLICKK